MTRLLLDQGLPRSAVQRLAAQGIDVYPVADIGYSRATDEKITALAFANCAHGRHGKGL